MGKTSTVVSQEASREETYYLVLDDFGGQGRAWCETMEGDANRNALLFDLMTGLYYHPVRIVAFKWSRDVTVDIADELRRRFAEYDEVPWSVQEFLERAGRPPI